MQCLTRHYRARFCLFASGPVLRYKTENKSVMSTRTLKLTRFSASLVVFFALAGPALAQGWMPFKINTGGNDLNTVYFLDAKRGWAGGDAGYLGHTEDGGQSWVRQKVGTTAGINDIYFRDKE